MSVKVLTHDEQKAVEQRRALPRFLIFPAGVLALWALAVGWPSSSWFVIAAWTVYHGYILFCWTSCFHETAHQTLNGSRAFSLLLGRTIGTIMLVPYTVYRESHIRHHAYLNKPTDWELWPYSDPNTSVWFRRAFVWVDLIFGALTAPYVYGRIFFHRDSPLQPAQRRAAAFEYLAIALFWGTVLGVVATYGAWWLFVRTWVLSHLAAGIFQSSRKLTEHLGMSSYDPLAGTRTVIGAGWFTKLCTFFNFDIFIHGPHHRHPRIAHDRLKNKMDEYRTTNPAQNYPVFSTYVAASRDMLPWMFRNPGVGMNVGAPPPEREKSDEVADFVTDVTEEVLGDADRIDRRPRPVPKPHSNVARAASR